MAAARAGHKVAALDIFNDVETRRSCFYSAQVAFRDGGFDADDLLAKLEHLDLVGATVVYGSGLENQPELLERIASRFALLGNTASTVAQVKDARRFFPLLDSLGIAYPETVFTLPPDPAGWLAKADGGSGGTHIRPYDGYPGGYYQRCVEGLPVSVLFLADGKEIQVVGFNEQWLAPTPGMPFRYGGAVGNAVLPDEVKQAMADAAHKVTVATGLRGLNSMDFMLGPQGPLALEINPRLSATFDLYEVPDLLERHLRACEGLLTPLSPPQGAKASLVYYAIHSIQVTEQVDWPSWVVDRPLAGSRIRAGEPLCSILAEGGTAAEAKALVFARARQLEAQCRTLRT